MTNKDVKKQEHKEFINRKHEDKCPYYQEFTNKNKKELNNYVTQQMELVALADNFQFVLEKWIIKYYLGLFSIEYLDDKKIQRLLNMWLYDFFKKWYFGNNKYGK